MGESFHRARRGSQTSLMTSEPGTPSKADTNDVFARTAPPVVPIEEDSTHAQKKSSSPGRIRARKSTSSNGSEEDARGKENMRRVRSDGELNGMLKGMLSNPTAIPTWMSKDDASIIGSMCRSMSTGHMSSSDGLSDTECYVTLASIGAGGGG